MTTSSPSAADATTGASVLRGGIWTTASKVAPQFFTIAVSIAGARFLGAAGLGRQSFIAFVATSAVYVLGLGIPVSLMRHVSEALGAGQPARARGLIVWSWRFAIPGATVGLVGLLVVAATGAKPQLAWILAAATVAVGVLSAIPDAVLTALQRWREKSIVVLSAAALGAAATIAVLAAGGGVTGMIAVQLGAAALILAWQGAMARSGLRARAPASADPEGLRGATLRFAASAFLGNLFTLIVFRRSEFFFLDHYEGSRAIALYSVAFSAMSTLVLIPQALTAVVSPAIATLLGAGQHDRISTGYGRIVRLLMLAALPIVAVGLALGPELLRLLFGPAFRGSGVPLMILLAPFPLIPAMNATYSVILGLRRIRFPLLVGAGSAVLNVALDLALIPGHAAVGAATANALAQGITAAVVIAYGRRLVGGSHWQPGNMIRLALCCAAGGVAARAALDGTGSGVPGLVAGLAAGAIVLAALARLLRVISHEDAAWLRRTAGTRFGGAIVRLTDALEVR